MFAKETYVQRRAQLKQTIGSTFDLLGHVFTLPPVFHFSLLFWLVVCLAVSSHRHR